MKLINGNIDQLFKERLSDFNATPPKEVWDRIENDLLYTRKRAMMPILIKVAAAVILLIGVGGLILKYSNRTGDYEQTSQENQVQTPVQNLKNDQTNKNIGANENDPVKENEPYMALSKDQRQKTKIRKTNKLYSEADQEYRLTENENPSSEKDIALASQNSLGPVIHNVYLMKESEMEIQKGIATKAVPVYQYLQSNSYSAPFAEKETSDRDHTMQWSVGGQAGPQYTYREVVVNDPASQNIDLDDYESGVITYAGGVNVQLGTSSRFSFQSGVYYSKIGTNKAEINAPRPVTYVGTDEDYFRSAPTDIANSTGSFTYDKGLTYGDTPYDNSDVEYVKGPNIVKEFFEYIEIPFVIRYKIIDRKLDLDLNGGIWTNFLIGMDASSTSDQPIEITPEPDNINKINYSGSIGIGIDYPVASNILFNLEPVFKYYLSPINNLEATRVHPYSFGILTGIKYSF